MANLALGQHPTADVAEHECSAQMTVGLERGQRIVREWDLARLARLRRPETSVDRSNPASCGRVKSGQLLQDVFS
jgi:hypothetical protein